MAVVCKKILALSCFFTMVSNAIATVSCLSGATCVDLRECTGLYNGLLAGGVRVSPTNINLIKSLHCGLKNDKPMICCPLEYRVTTAIKASYKSFNPLDLLPDLKVCGIQNNVFRIEGSWTELNEHPWLALLRYERPVGSGFYCGGVLISSKYVLTAAHCVDQVEFPENWKLSHVRLGEWNLTREPDCYYNDCSPPALDVPVEEVIAHANYDSSDYGHQNDIALIRLAREVEFNDFVKPICLPINSELRHKSFEDFILEIAGWGTMGSNSNIKLKGNVPIVNNRKCQETYIKVGKMIMESQLCGGGSGSYSQHFCRGDSGGPLMGLMPSSENLIVIGVASYGPSPCNTAGWPGVYTRVSAYVDWILSKIRP